MSMHGSNDTDLENNVLNDVFKNIFVSMVQSMLCFDVLKPETMFQSLDN